jgi:hypothetical protein
LDLAKIHKEFKGFFLALQSKSRLTSRSYLDYTNLAFNSEEKFTKKLSENHQRKVRIFCRNRDVVLETSNLNPQQPRPEILI